MRKISLSAAMLSAGCTILFSAQITLSAPVSFQQAVQHYTAGKYAQANTELESYKQAYPNNAMVHYYLALCKQALGQLEQAKAEYQWVSQNGDVRLRGMAQAGFDQLSKARSSVSHTSTASSTAQSTATGASAPQATSSTVVATAKVKKIIEFWAEW